MEIWNMPIPEAKKVKFIILALECNARNIEVHSRNEPGILRAHFMFESVDDCNLFKQRWELFTTPIVEIRKSPLRRWFERQKRLHRGRRASIR